MVVKTYRGTSKYWTTRGGGGSGISPVHFAASDPRLWELILADDAETEFIELTVSQVMQSIDHVVMTTAES